jgi:enamine deaminase RidA (YjgF/YER057c/UK114 family)
MAAMAAQRIRISTGTKWEKLAGYSRAVRIGPHVWVSGTTATNDKGELEGGTDPAAQTRFILKKIERALNDAGASISDVVRTRIYVKNVADWEPVARVHGEVFRDILPADTMVEARLIGEEYLVEIEAEAYTG